MKTAKKSLAILLALVMSFTCFSLIGFAEETEAPEHLTEVPEGYVGIYTKDDLDNIKLDVTGSYILMNDIVFEDSDYVKGGSFYNSGKGWDPIGTSSSKFTGTFDGNGYSIKNLYINNPEQNYIGLFGYINAATINNVSLVGADITGKNYVGGITGYNYGISTIEYCNTNGTITGNQYVGGIAGYQYAYSSSSYDEHNYIRYSNNSSNVSGASYIGGIVGYSQSYPSGYYDGKYSLVLECSNSGNINSTVNFVGGIVGYSVGGYCSSVYYGKSYHHQFTTSCYNLGDVTSEGSYAGGIIGHASTYTSVKHCYSVGIVTATDCFGGCFGSTPDSVNFCYYLDEAVVNPTCTSGTEKSEDQLKKATAYEQWDFKETWTMGGRDDYPYPELVDVPLILPEDFSAHEHSYTSVITKEATHTETGVMTYTCECGDSYTGAIEKITDHTYTSVVTAPTCTEKGFTTYTCACGDTYVDNYVNAKGHNYESVVTAPTCTEQGYTTFTCACGHSYVGNYVKPTGHNYDAIVTAPTCIEQGYTTYTCSCGDTYTGSFVTAKGHIYTSVVTAPTCTEKGFTTYICACGDTYVANYVNATGHTYTSKVTKEATHLETGVMTYTCACGDAYTEEIAKTTDHTYTSVVTASTCTEKGYTTYTCSCGDTYVGDYVNAKGHTPATTEENYVAPTCTANGSKDVVTYCTVCDTEISRETVVINATGHADNNGDGYCDADKEPIENDPIADCGCNCHKSGITKFFFDFLLFFQRIFGSNKMCSCGVAHY